jgi:hypothetical protein
MSAELSVEWCGGPDLAEMSVELSVEWCGGPGMGSWLLSTDGLGSAALRPSYEIFPEIALEIVLLSTDGLGSAALRP